MDIDTGCFYFDLSAYQKSDFRKYELDIFGINAQKFPRYLKPFIQKSKKSILESLKPIKRFKEKEFFTYDKSIENINHSIYLDGYWQSEKYFKKYENLIRDIFQFPKIKDDENLKVANEIVNSESISIHVRHGDYLASSKTNEFHGTCGIEYYKKSIEYITSKLENSTFFIFSDDIKWCEEKFVNVKNKTIISHNTGLKSYEDMRLMSLCKHNIIANSSFSWWSAWLNTNPNKIVIAPKKWINDENYETPDICPIEWMRF
ncbi:MAG: alpha-1,2-fucosyltransferase [Campylobacterales bacterium]